MQCSASTASHGTPGLGTGRKARCVLGQIFSTTIPSSSCKRAQKSQPTLSPPPAAEVSGRSFLGRAELELCFLLHVSSLTAVLQICVVCLLGSACPFSIPASWMPAAARTGTSGQEVALWCHLRICKAILPQTHTLFSVSQFSWRCLLSEFFFKDHPEFSIVVPPTVASASLQGPIYTLATPRHIQLCADGPQKAVVQVLRLVPSVWETQMGLQALGFCLDQPWLFLPFGE